MIATGATGAHAQHPALPTLAIKTMLTLRSSSPFDLFDRLEQQLSQQLQSAERVPAAEVHESADAYEVVLELPGGERWAIEVKRSHAARPARGFHEACEDLKPARRLVVHAGADSYPISQTVEAIGLATLMQGLTKLQ